MINIDDSFMNKSVRSIWKYAGSPKDTKYDTINQKCVLDVVPVRLTIWTTQYEDGSVGRDSVRILMKDRKNRESRIDSNLEFEEFNFDKEC